MACLAAAMLLLGGCLHGGPEPCESVVPLVCMSDDGACHDVAASGDDEDEARRAAEAICTELHATPVEAECPIESVCFRRMADAGCGEGRVETTYPLLTEAQAREACAAAGGLFVPATGEDA